MTNTPDLFSDWWDDPAPPVPESLFAMTAPTVVVKPTTRPLRPYQSAAADTVDAGFAKGLTRLLLVAATGTGKCLGKGTPVLLFDGTIKPVEEIVVGDLLMGPDSKHKTVLSLATGHEEMYRVTPVKGEPYIVNKSHILSLQMTGARWHGLGRGDVLNISVTDYLALPAHGRHILKGWRTGVDFSPTDNLLSLEPYFLGVWLGDGETRGIEITKPDPEIGKYLSEYAARLGMTYSLHTPKDRCVRHAITGSKTLWDGLRKYNLFYNKHVPRLYKSGSRETRLEILAGLIDTDGSLTCGGYDFSSKFEILARDVAFLARSLGLAAYVTPMRKRCANTDKWGDYWRVSISGNVDMIPCKIERRKAAPRQQKKDVLRTGIKVEPTEVGEYFGFELDGDGLFLLGDFTVTHNTRTASEVIDRHRGTGRVLWIAHTDELIDQARRSILAEMPGAVVTVEKAERVASPHSDVIVASVQTLGRQGCTRLEWLARQKPSLIICDEAHHITSVSYQDVLKRFGAYNGVKMIGLTATPKRLDKKALVGPDGMATFQEVAHTYSILDAITDGYLCQIRGYRVTSDVDLDTIKTDDGDFAQKALADACQDPRRTKAMIDRWEEVARDRSTIVFCAGVENAERDAAMWRARGYSAGCVHGALDMETRKDILAKFAAGKIQVVTNMGVLTEGWDGPFVSCVVTHRPTKSWGLFVQMVGRGTRLKPAGCPVDLVVIDTVDNTSRHALCSVASILDLPSGLDLQGRKLTEVKQKMDELAEKRTRAPKDWTPKSYEELVTRLEAIDLLTQVIPTDPAVKARSSFEWVAYPDGDTISYRLGCGSYLRTEDGPNGEKIKISLGQKTATLRRDTLSAWRLVLNCQLPRPRSGDGMPETPMEHTTIPENLRTAPGWDGLGDEEYPVFAVAEARIKTYWPYAGAIASADAPWKTKPASDKQKGILRRNMVRLELDGSAVDAMTMGDASRLLDRLFGK